MKKLTLNDLKVIREKMNTALQEIGKEYDATFQIGNMRYTEKRSTVAMFTTKLTCEFGDYVDPTLQWRMEAELGETDTKKVYDYQGQKIQFTGYSMRAKRYPWIYKVVGGIKAGESRKCTKSFAKEVVESSQKS